MKRNIYIFTIILILFIFLFFIKMTKVETFQTFQTSSKDRAFNQSMRSHYGIEVIGGQKYFIGYVHSFTPVTGNSELITLNPITSPKNPKTPHILIFSRQSNRGSVPVDCTSDKPFHCVEGIRANKEINAGVFKKIDTGFQYRGDYYGNWKQKESKNWHKVYFRGITDRGVPNTPDGEVKILNACELNNVKEKGKYSFCPECTSNGFCKKCDPSLEVTNSNYKCSLRMDQQYRQPCISKTQCSSGNCDFKKKKCDKQVHGGACQNSNDCISNNCDMTKNTVRNWGRCDDKCITYQSGALGGDNCKDTKAECKYWSTLGHCNTPARKPYMDQNCAHTCKTCTQGDIDKDTALRCVKCGTGGECAECPKGSKLGSVEGKNIKCVSECSTDPCLNEGNDCIYDDQCIDSVCKNKKCTKLKDGVACKKNNVCKTNKCDNGKCVNKCKKRNLIAGRGACTNCLEDGTCGEGGCSPGLTRTGEGCWSGSGNGTWPTGRCTYNAQCTNQQCNYDTNFCTLTDESTRDDLKTISRLNSCQNCVNQTGDLQGIWDLENEKCIPYVESETINGNKIENVPNKQNYVVTQKSGWPPGYIQSSATNPNKKCTATEINTTLEIPAEQNQTLFGKENGNKMSDCFGKCKSINGIPSNSLTIEDYETHTCDIIKRKKECKSCILDNTPYSPDICKCNPDGTYSTDCGCIPDITNQNSDFLNLITNNKKCSPIPKTGGKNCVVNNQCPTNDCVY
jgi:hypothetical protein